MASPLLLDKFSDSLDPFRNDEQQHLEVSACSYSVNETHKLIKLFLSNVLFICVSDNLEIVSLNMSSRFST